MYNEGVLVSEFRCPEFWSLKTLQLLIEDHLNAPDRVVFKLFYGPEILSGMLMENITLADIRNTLTRKNLRYSKIHFPI